MEVRKNTEKYDRTEKQKIGNIQIKTLPADFFYLLTKYVSGMDVVRLSCVCQYLYEVFRYDKVWKDLFKRDGLKLDSAIMKAAMKEFGSRSNLDLRNIGLEKAFYICHKKVDMNWKNGKYKYFVFKEADKMSRDDDHP